MKITLHQNAPRLVSIEQSAEQMIFRCDTSATPVAVTMHPEDYEQMPAAFHSRCIIVTHA